MSDLTVFWPTLLGEFAAVFTAPSFGIFCRMAAAWVLCPGRRTITRIYGLAEPVRARAHDAYHRFFRAGAWCMAELWRRMATLLVQALYPTGVISLSLDDTAFHKTGRKIAGAAWWRDAVRSTGQKVVHCFGLNVVVLTLDVVPPWGGEPLGLPINMRVHRKGEATLLELAEAMVREVASWFPEREFALCADGFYASLAGADLPRTSLTSRMRRDAALYAPPPPRVPGKRGRPRKRGKRLPTPAQRAAKTTHWRRVSVEIRGKTKTRLVSVHDLLWYRVSPGRLVRLVISRDPEGKEKDDFFFTTDLAATPAEVIARYARRWSIEDTFKNVKQLLGGQHPQLWTHQGPERATAFSFWLYSAVWHSYLTTCGARPCWLLRPWYRKKSTPSFADALATLRRALWCQRVFSHSEDQPLRAENLMPLINALAYAG